MVLEVVTKGGAGGVEDVERGSTSVDAKDVSVDGTEGEVTVVVVEEVMLSDEEEKRIEGVELVSGGVAWAGFDSSHRPFLQQGDSRKSNTQEETLSTTTTATGLKTHAQFRSTTRNGHANSTHISAFTTFCSTRGKVRHGAVGQLVSLSICNIEQDI